jgi:hypothetical protein
VENTPSDNGHLKKKSKRDGGSGASLGQVTKRLTAMHLQWGEWREMEVVAVVVAAAALSTMLILLWDQMVVPDQPPDAENIRMTTTSNYNYTFEKRWKDSLRSGLSPRTTTRPWGRSLRCPSARTTCAATEWRSILCFECTTVKGKKETIGPYCSNRTLQRRKYAAVKVERRMKQQSEEHFNDRAGHTLFLDGKFKGNNSRYINYSCDPASCSAGW